MYPNLWRVFLWFVGMIGINYFLCGCDTSKQYQKSFPPPPPAKTSLFHAFCVHLGLKTSLPEPAPFVAQSRAESSSEDFLPIGIVPPRRPVPPRTPQELQQLEEELQRTQDIHEQLLP